MARNKSHDTIIANRRERVARLRLRGLTQRDIVEALSRAGTVDPETQQPCSLTTINRDLKAIEADWRAAATQSTEARKAAQLAELAEVKRAAWAKDDHVTVLKAIAQEVDITGTKARTETDVTSGGQAFNIILDR